MDIGTAILIIGFAALAAAFCLLVIGLVFSEVMNSEIPPGVSNRGKLHLLHCCVVGIAVGVSVHIWLNLFLAKSLAPVPNHYAYLLRIECCSLIQLYTNLSLNCRSVPRCLSLIILVCFSTTGQVII